MTNAGPDDRLPGDRLPEARPRSAGKGVLARQIWWTSMPIWSLGFLCSVPFLVYAVGRRRGRDWAVFAGYLAATIAFALAVAGTTPGTIASKVGGLLGLAMIGGAATHAFVLFRPGRGPAASVFSSVRQNNQAAVAQAKDRIERRKQAQHLLATDPALARDLMIGRPDLYRQYDDGGLVDVNHVPGPVLGSALGLAPGEVTDVLAARDKLGRFTNPDELCAFTQLTPQRVAQLSDLMIFT